MLIHLDPHSGVPVYRQLMEQIKFQIASGVLRPEDELPSTRALAADLGVNPMTVSKAYGYLESEGVIERRPGRPLVVRAHGSDTREHEGREQLRHKLTAPALMARQLGIDPDTAVDLFRELLERNGAETDEHN